MDHNELVETVKDHENRIRDLEIDKATMTEQIKSLCKQLGSLTGWLKALVGIIATALVGFFVFAIENHLFNKR